MVPLPEGSSFPPSIWVYIYHLRGSRGNQKAPHMKRELSSPSSSPLMGRDVADCPLPQSH